MTTGAELNRKFSFGTDLIKILPDLFRLRTKAEKPDISKRSKGTIWQKFMLIINVSTKKLIKKEKNTNFTPISDVLFLRLACN